MRTIIIGDIHGHIDPLRRIMEALSPDPATDRLVFLGDLFDRGPDSWEVFQYVKKLAASFGERFVLLRGNHEDYLLQETMPPAQRMIWDRVGRGATVLSFKQHGEEMEDARPWLQEHTVLFYKEDRFQCVHAGLKVDPVEANDAYTLIHDHGVALKNRYAGPLTVTGHIAVERPTWFCGDKKTIRELDAEDISGREAEVDTGAGEDLPVCGILCIDTGCGKGGPLTAMVIKEGQYRLYQADAGENE